MLYLLFRVRQGAIDKPWRSDLPHGFKVLSGQSVRNRW